jgi:predicted RNA polymerase sigma factor
VRVLTLIYMDEQAWDSLSDEGRNAVYAEHAAFRESAGSKVLKGAELAPTRADLLRRLERLDEAAAAYRRALELAQTEPERRSLLQRLSEVS